MILGALCNSDSIESEKCLRTTQKDGKNFPCVGRNQFSLKLQFDLLFKFTIKKKQKQNTKQSVNQQAQFLFLCVSTPGWVIRNREKRLK